MENVVQRVKKFMHRLKAAEGVTLIELLAVVVILAIIAAVAVPAVLGQISKSKINADKQNEQVLADAIQRMVLDAESQGYSNVQIGTISSSTFTPAGNASTLATDVVVSYTSSTSYTQITCTDTTKTALKDILLNGVNGGSGGYLSTWPAPQTVSSGDWTFGTASASTPSQTVTIAGTSYNIAP